MKDWETMIDRIGTEQDYSRYTPGANLVKRNTESEEKFSLDRQDIKSAEEKTSAEEIKEWKISPFILNEFKNYSKLYQASNGNAGLLKATFGNTYWYYFHNALIER